MNEKFSSVVEKLRNGESIYSACNNSGINICVFFSEYKTNADFKKMVDESREVRCLLIEDSIYTMAMRKGNFDAAESYLANYGKWTSIKRRR